jgi:serine/threonine protein kinase
MERLPCNVKAYREGLIKLLGDKPIPPEMVIRFIRHGIRALEYLHSKEIVHR